MEYNQTLERLGKWINVLHKSILVFAGIEALIVLIIGVASSNIYHEKYSDFWTAILVILGILYLIITMIKIAYKKSFPTSIIDELKSKKSLETANDSIKRKDAINNYISNTVIALSNCKCEIPVLKEEDDWKLYSDKDFKKGIKSLTLTFNSILNILLNTSNIKFSTAIYVNDFRAIKHENHPGNNSGIFFLRDDYEIEKINTLRDLMSENNLSGLDLEIQNKIKVSFNNGKYLAEEIETKKDKKILLICSNIKD